MLKSNTMEWNTKLDIEKSIIIIIIIIITETYWLIIGTDLMKKLSELFFLWTTMRCFPHLQ